MAKILVYSMSIDGEVRDSNAPVPRVRGGQLPKQTGYIVGSKAVDSLDRLITSTESFFHPSNSGYWTTGVRLLRFLLSTLTYLFPWQAHNIFATIDGRIYQTHEGGRAGHL